LKSKQEKTFSSFTYKSKGMKDTQVTINEIACKHNQKKLGDKKKLTCTKLPQPGVA
jgi:hypothetical protein